ncbi:MAG: phosphoheptose isomerase [Neisseriaceae bacterium]|nr:phosphoheptose isomerase [Neisseriaceae bacterium]MBP6862565.1 phosphoheptose isomerase [Neisseriaceae bacterium]
MSIVDRVSAHFAESIEAKKQCQEILPEAVAEGVQLMVNTLMMEGKLLACGNGGSAADAQHFAAEMVGRFEQERPGLAAISLATDTSALTAIGNDYEFDLIFSKQVRALGKENDVLLAISTSGNSANVVEAVKAAHEKGMKVIALTGKDGGKIAGLLNGDDVLLNVPHPRTARVQEIHILLIHALCDGVDYMLLGGD